MAFTQGHALVVGADRGDSAAGLGEASFTAGAEAVAEALADAARGGLPPEQVTLLRGEAATPEALRAALDALVGGVTPDDTLVVFYGGVALLDWRELLGALDAMPARHALIVFDVGYAERDLPPALFVPALLAHASRAVIVACQEDERALAGEGPATLFAVAFAEALGGAGVPRRGQFIGSFDLYGAVLATVRAASGGRQQPALFIALGGPPFAVALHAERSGEGSLGVPKGDDPSSFRAPPFPPETDAVTALSPQESAAALGRLLGLATAAPPSDTLSAEPPPLPQPLPTGVLSPEDPPTLVERRVEAAMPATVMVGVETEVRVRVTTPGGPGLDLPSTTASGQLIRPEDVEELFTLVEIPSGQQSMRVWLALDAPDFTLDPAARLDLRIYRDHPSNQARLRITPTRPSPRSSVDVHLYADEAHTQRIDTLTLYAAIVAQETTPIRAMGLAGPGGPEPQEAPTIVNNYIYAQGSQGFVFQPTGAVTQTFGG